MVYYGLMGLFDRFLTNKTPILQTEVQAANIPYNLQASVAAGLQSAGEVDGAAGIVGLGIAAGGVGIANLQQPVGASTPSSRATTESTGGDSELMARLQQLKSAFDAGLITQEDFDAARAKALGL